MEESIIKLDTKRNELNDGELLDVVQEYREKAKDAYLENDMDTAVFCLNIANVCANQLGYMDALKMEELIKKSNL